MPASCSRSSTPTLAARPRARASTATRTSSSGRCWAGLGTCTSAMPWPPGTTPDGTSTPSGRVRLLRARDEDKDQTYFLYGLRAEQLEHARFPLGELTKPEVRSVARSLGLVTADKPESQEICFVPGGDYRDALRERAAWSPVAGPLVDVDGAVVGTHGGSAAYTVGQRQGLGVALGQPRYVSRIDPALEHDPAGAARGPRDADVHHRAGVVRRRIRHPAVRSAHPCASAIGARSSRHRSLRSATDGGR